MYIKLSSNFGNELIKLIKFIITIIVAIWIPAKFKHISKRIKQNNLNIQVMANEIMLA